MEEAVRITIRSGNGRFKDMDIQVNARQTWEHIVKVLRENGLIPEEAEAPRFYSQRRKCSFEAGESSAEAGIYTGDIIEIII